MKWRHRTCLSVAFLDPGNIDRHVATPESSSIVAAPEALAALSGAAVVAAARRARSGLFNAVLEVAGLALIGTALAGPVRRHLLRAGERRRSVHLHLALSLDAPVHELFEFCRDFENFTHIIGGLHGVIDYHDGRSHWEIVAPSGEIIGWDAVVTKYVPNSVIAWQSVPGSAVRSGGLVRFAPAPGGGTRLDLSLDYEPIATSLNDAIHALLDVPREEQLRAELARAPFYFRSWPRPESESPDAAADGRRVSA